MIIKSLLDTDFYKISMGQVVFYDFPDVWVNYQFTNRAGTEFPAGFDKALISELWKINSLYLLPDENVWMRRNPHFRTGFIEWFSGYRYDPEEVSVIQNGGDLFISIEGYWFRTIHWEVMLMALISELYFKMTGKKMSSDAFDKIDIKANKMQSANALWSDFGTRRRYSYDVQDQVVKRMSKYRGFLGTSNPHLAMKYGVKVIGTFAHEAPMAMQAVYGIRHCNREWLRHWYNFYRGELGVALTDTITTKAFLKDFGPLEARIYEACRHDSSDPYKWGNLIIDHYKTLNINPMTKGFVFSDGLNTDDFIDISNYFSDKIGRVVGGIGTHLTNDVGVTPLNMVIKLKKVRVNKNSKWIDVVKLSDVLGKESGSESAIQNAKYEIQNI